MTVPDHNQQQQPLGFSFGDLWGTLLTHVLNNPDVRQKLATALAGFIMTALENVASQRTSNISAPQMRFTGEQPQRMAGDESLRREGIDTSTADQPSQIKAG